MNGGWRWRVGSVLAWLCFSLVAGAGVPLKNYPALPCHALPNLQQISATGADFAILLGSRLYDATAHTSAAVRSTSSTSTCKQNILMPISFVSTKTSIASTILLAFLDRFYY